MPRNPPRSRSPGARSLPQLPVPESTDARIEATIELIRTTGATPRTCALRAGFSNSGWYRTLDGRPDLLDRIAQAEATFKVAMSSVIVSNAVRLRSWKAALAILAVRWPGEYGPQLALHVDDQGPDRIAEMSPEELAVRLRAVIAEVVDAMAEPERIEFLAAMADPERRRQWARAPEAEPAA